jgi:hypothetical protein
MNDVSNSNLKYYMNSSTDFPNPTKKQFVSQVRPDGNKEQYSRINGKVEGLAVFENNKYRLQCNYKENKKFGPYRLYDKTTNTIQEGIVDEKGKVQPKRYLDCTALIPPKPVSKPELEKPSLKRKHPTTQTNDPSTKRYMNEDRFKNRLVEKFIIGPNKEGKTVVQHIQNPMSKIFDRAVNNS